VQDLSHPEEPLMPTTLKAKFDTRREAEMTVERLVQEMNVERTDIFITTDGADNSAGDERAGADTAGDNPTPASRADAALEGKIIVSVDIADAGRASDIKAAFAEFDASEVAER
jgi:hypothetical protein